MKLTNHTGIPKPIFDVMETYLNSHPKMDSNQFSATECLNSARQIYLKRMVDSDNDKVRDVQQVMRTIRGTWNHKTLENELDGRKGCTVEPRYKVTISVHTFFGEQDVELSGGIDLLYEDEDGELHIIDWKTTTQYKMDSVRNGEDLHWKKQAFIYAFLTEEHLGRRPVDATFVGFLDDKKVSGIDFTDESTLPVQMVKYDLSDMEFEKSLREEISTKIGKVIDYQDSVSSPEKCTKEDRWQGEKYFGVKKSDGKVWKHFPTMQEANAYVAGLKTKGSYIFKEFPSKPTRCLDFCECYNICNQGQRLVKEYLDSLEK